MAESDVLNLLEYARIAGRKTPRLHIDARYVPPHRCGEFIHLVNNKLRGTEVRSQLFLLGFTEVPYPKEQRIDRPGPSIRQIYRSGQTKFRISLTVRELQTLSIPLYAWVQSVHRRPAETVLPPEEMEALWAALELVRQVTAETLLEVNPGLTIRLSE